MKARIAYLESVELSHDVFLYNFDSKTTITPSQIDMALRRRILATMHGGRSDPNLLSSVAEVEENNIGNATITNVIQIGTGYAFVGYDDDHEVDVVGIVQPLG